MDPRVLVVQTGTANVASVLAGLKRAGGQPVLGNDPRRVAEADRVVLPGVGAMQAAMTRLQRDDLNGVLCERLHAGRPTLAICLGMQLLCTGSEENPGVKGLGVLAAGVERFGTGVRVPQMGWNEVLPGDGCRYLQRGFAYFANSYRLPNAPKPWRTAWSDHGGPFVAAVEKGEVLGCQFHPELSGPWGLDLLVRWIAGRPEGGSTC